MKDLNKLKKVVQANFGLTNRKMWKGDLKDTAVETPLTFFVGECLKTYSVSKVAKFLEVDEPTVYYFSEKYHALIKKGGRWHVKSKLIENGIKLSA